MNGYSLKHITTYFELKVRIALNKWDKTVTHYLINLKS